MTTTPLSVAADGFAIAFTFDGGKWSAACEHDYIKYSAADVQFKPLPARAVPQIRNLFKNKCKAQLSADQLTLSWYVELLDQSVVVRLDKETITSDAKLLVEMRRQRDQIVALQKECRDLSARISRFQQDEKEAAEKARVHRIMIELDGEKVFKFTDAAHEKLVLEHYTKNAANIFVKATDAELREIRKCKTMLGLAAHAQVRPVLGMHANNRGLLDALHVAGFRLLAQSYVQTYGAAPHYLSRAYIEYVVDGFTGVNIYAGDYRGLSAWVASSQVGGDGDRVVKIPDAACGGNDLSSMTLIYKY